MLSDTMVKSVLIAKDNEYDGELGMVDEDGKVREDPLAKC